MVISSLYRGPASAPCVFSNRARTHAWQAASPLCASYGLRAWIFCVLLCSVLRYWPLVLAFLRLNLLQLRVLLYQLLQAEARELYRNLRLFTVSFTLIDGSFAILWVTYFLPWPETFFTFGFFHWHFGETELFPSGSKELRHIFDRVVGLSAIRGSWSALLSTPRPAYALVFIFIGIMRGRRRPPVGGASLRYERTPALPRRAYVLQ